MISTLLDSVELSGSPLSTRRVTKELSCMAHKKVEFSMEKGGKIDVRIKKTKSCWNWIGHVTPDGYGIIRFGGKNYRAHRLVYELLVGKIPTGLVCDHLCRNKKCVNPKHIEPVTSKVNTLRGTGLTAQNARKKDCKRGHPLSGKNLKIIRGRTYRTCRACHNELWRILRMRKRTARAEIMGVIERTV